MKEDLDALRGSWWDPPPPEPPIDGQIGLFDQEECDENLPA